jgi:hypothetical protein
VRTDLTSRRFGSSAQRDATPATLLCGTNQKGDAAMKKHSVVSLLAAGCLAGLIGQLAAVGATTNSTWDVSSISTLKAGKIHGVVTNTASVVFLSDGTASLLFKGHEYDGTYTNNTKQLTFTLGTNSIATVKSDLTALVQPYAPPGVTATVTGVKFSPKIKLSMTGVPGAFKDTAKGKGCETVGSKTKCKSFSLTTLWTNWVLSSGTPF